MTTALALIAPPVTLRTHRDRFPRTDHGFAWLDSYWFEVDGERISPTCPDGGGCDRLGCLPGDLILSSLAFDIRVYAEDGYQLKHTETTHPGFHHVRSGLVVRVA